MKVRNLNASTERTRNRIKTAFLEMHSEGIAGDKMTIGDLASRAGISRSTFYTHYNDLYDLGDQLAVEEAKKILGDKPIKAKQDVKALFIRFTEFLRQNEAALRMLLCSDYPHAFFLQLQGQMKQYVREVDTDDKAWRIRAATLIDGAIQQATHWLQSPKSSDIELLCAALLDCCDRLL